TSSRSHDFSYCVKKLPKWKMVVEALASQPGRSLSVAELHSYLRSQMHRLNATSLTWEHDIRKSCESELAKPNPCIMLLPPSGKDGVERYKLLAHEAEDASSPAPRVRRRRRDTKEDEEEPTSNARKRREPPERNFKLPKRTGSLVDGDALAATTSLAAKRNRSSYPRVSKSRSAQLKDARAARRLRASEEAEASGEAEQNVPCSVESQLSECEVGILEGLPVGDSAVSVSNLIHAPDACVESGAAAISISEQSEINAASPSFDGPSFAAASVADASVVDCLAVGGTATPPEKDRAGPRSEGTSRHHESIAPQGNAVAAPSASLPAPSNTSSTVHASSSTNDTLSSPREKHLALDGISRLPELTMPDAVREWITRVATRAEEVAIARRATAVARAHARKNELGAPACNTSLLSLSHRLLCPPTPLPHLLSCLGHLSFLSSHHR
ncbi:MAG: hypothetical protein SGPRY_012745, partial [Prymnesium sp.]